MPSNVYIVLLYFGTIVYELNLNDKGKIGRYKIAQYKNYHTKLHVLTLFVDSIP